MFDKEIEQKTQELKECLGGLQKLQGAQEQQQQRALKLDGEITGLKNAKAILDAKKKK